MVTLNFFPPCLRNTASAAGCLMSVSSKIKVDSLIAYGGIYQSCAFTSPIHTN